VAVRETAASGFGELAASLAEALAAIQESLSHVPARSRPLGERVAIDLARAEAVRARWLAESALVLQSDPLPSLDEVDLGKVFRTVSDALAPEHRLAGGAPTLTMPEDRCSVFGDERLLTTALGSLLAALRRLIEERGDPSRVEVSIAPRVDTASRTVEVTQSAVRVPAAALARFFDAGWSDHPAGAVGALLLAASRRIADAHGGSLEIAAIDGGGCRLALSLPAAG
jgi:signal transduction histidine kinase